AHDLEQNADVVFRLVHVLGALDAERGQVRAQARERPLVQEAGQVVRGVRQQLAAADADKNVEELEFDILELDAVGRIREFRMQKPERTRVGAQAGYAFDKARIGRTQKQSRKKNIFRC